MTIRLIPREYVPVPQVGQVWLDLDTPGRTLTINRFYLSETGRYYAVCTAFNPRKKRRKCSITTIRADRFRYYTIAVVKDWHQMVIISGFKYLERVEVDNVLEKA